MTETKVFKKHDNLSKKELNTKNNREVYVRNDILTIFLKHCRDKKKRVKIKIAGIRKKLMILNSEISVYLEYDTKWKIRNVLVLWALQKITSWWKWAWIYIL